MMGSSPVADNELYSLLKLISDPDGAKQRLDALSSQAAANAESYRQQVADIEEATAKANEVIAKAAADEAQAAANTAQANALLAKNEAWFAELSEWDTNRYKQEAELAGSRGALATISAKQEAEFEARGAALAQAEDANRAATDKIRAEQASVASLKAQLEDKLAAIRKLAD